MGGKVQPPTRKHFSAGCQRWLVCFKSDGLDDGTRGGRLVASGNRGVRVGAVDIGLGYVQNDDHVFFKAKAVTPLKTNMTMENAQLEDGFPIET